jgi:hypothetical protein
MDSGRDVKRMMELLGMQEQEELSTLQHSDDEEEEGREITITFTDPEGNNDIEKIVSTLKEFLDDLGWNVAVEAN